MAAVLALWHIQHRVLRLSITDRPPSCTSTMWSTSSEPWHSFLLLAHSTHLYLSLFFTCLLT
jgi:hypothetical protein